MPFRFRALLLALAAYVAVPAAAQVEGAYRLATINGQALPAPSPTENDVMLLRASFIFQPDGRFFMHARAADGNFPYSEGDEGTYRVRGDSLMLLPESSGGETVDFRWTLSGGTLHLIDESGHDYAFTRGPAPTAALLLGDYRLTHVNGQTLPSGTPTEGNVIIDELTVALGADGRYTMHARGIRENDSSPIAHDVRGTYSVDGDRLVLEPEEGQANADTAEFRWTLDGDTLLLVDEDDEEYTFSRAG
jgi:dipeptidyl aminopeptidase/acylaminoacyl peptidase